MSKDDQGHEATVHLDLDLDLDYHLPRPCKPKHLQSLVPIFGAMG